jgi:HEPN domain-containing protein
VRRTSAEQWAQARADLMTATVLRDAGCYYASVFFSQQASEKALKAISLQNFHKVHRGHNLIAIADYLHAPLDVMNCAAELNADYTAALYPEAAGGIPCQEYDSASANLHLGCAERIMDWSREHLFAGSERE